MVLRRHALLAVSIVLVLSGALILNRACAFAMLNMPPPEQLSAYRAVFYERAVLGVGCIILGIVALRWRRPGRAPGE